MNKNNLIIVLFFLIWLPKAIFSNNLTITSPPALTNPSPVDKHVFINFSLSWENSWRNSTNYDAVWVFVKYRTNNGPWEQAYLDTDASDYIVMDENGTGAQFEPGVNNISGQNRAVGVYLFRSSNGQGDINWQNILLKWNYGENGVNNHDSVTVQVFAIEMVKVPEGAFKVGDGSSFSRFHAGNSQTTPFQITGNAITFGTGSGNLWALGAWDSPTGTLNTNYPTGYNAFYCMKYNITQKQYVDFLNCLTRTQQNTRTATDLSPTISTVTNVFVMSNTPAPSYRNGIRCPATIATNAPVTFYCDLNNNGVMNENNDGQDLACNYLSWADGAAYAAWAGLRPMTETEYEKACRGTATPVAGEYAWGTVNIAGATSITNSGSPNETANSGANCVFNNAANVQGPMRAGAFANATSNRENAGATAYGIMEMSGNLWERAVSLGSATGRNFAGTPGNGLLNASGDALNADWPQNTAIGSGLRGGHWKGTNINAKISARDNGNYETAIRNEMFGFRAVRSAL